MDANPTPRSKLRGALDRAETPVLVLAAIAVALYLGSLAGTWTSLGVDTEVRFASGVLDAVFVADVLARVLVLRGEYLATGWFFIDVVAALPALATFAAAPSALRGLRFVRAMRVFRVLRSLRSLRVLRTAPCWGSADRQHR